MPVTDVDTLAPAGDDLRRADFLVYTTRLRSPEYARFGEAGCGGAHVDRRGRL